MGIGERKCKNGGKRARRKIKEKTLIVIVLVTGKTLNLTSSVRCMIARVGIHEIAPLSRPAPDWLPIGMCTL